MPQLTPGRIVMYRLTDEDARHISHDRAHHERRGNYVREGDRFPAVVVRTIAGGPGDAVNLQVLLDGEDTHWATSVREGDEPGTWAWPVRA